MRQLSICNQIGFPADFFDAIIQIKVTSVYQGIKRFPLTIWICNIFHYAQSIKHIMFYHLVVRENHLFRQSKTRKIFLVCSIYCLTC